MHMQGEIPLQGDFSAEHMIFGGEAALVMNVFCISKFVVLDMFSFYNLSHCYDQVQAIDL